MHKALGWVKYAILAGGVAAGCANHIVAQNEEEETGTVALPLVTYGSSGVEYRLRNATFHISSPYYYGGIGGAASTGGRPGTGASSSGGTPSTGITVSSETNPSAPSIEVDLEEGYYQIYLENGWSLERVQDGTATPVEQAQLLNGQWQWVYVSPRSTSWVTYQFGIGDRSIWFNGKLNVDIQVYETPDEYYGHSYGGNPGAGGAYPAFGGAVTAGGSIGF